MRQTWLTATTLAMAVLAAPAMGAEPNETYDTATWLPSGTLTVSDALMQPPNTLLAALDMFGDVNYDYFNDDDGPHAVTFASALTEVPSNSGTIRFAVTGVGDDSFFGSHSERGSYTATVTAHDVLGDVLDSFTTQIATLEPGVAHEYNFTAFGGYVYSYDVYINNVVNYVGWADMDFYTFTGLMPGTAFAAETLDPLASDVDTLLGWFNGSEFASVIDDDGGAGALSRLTGVVPANGQVTLGVTGSSDNGFAGEHGASGAYDLKLTLGGGGGYAADFNDDGYVNAADLLKWKQAFGQTAAGDANNDLRTDGTDFLIWQRQNGSGPAASESVAAVPEPSAIAISAFGVAVMFGSMRKRGRLNGPSRT